ncbi:E3 ubiquitin-protein ligase WAV3-like [Andrographis paniculata]|uniref:E3 ubiquitin-protein ligase WAV3-like n=1 Tax=Andrographis paniculata TaxID=175694 RepID=UPI0021E82A9B|nr:E3 ubiquitin-protein ligase WAV3-like [Andrographis paniculata]
MTSAQTNTCGICSENFPAAVHGQGIFTGGCSHSFHFLCISPTLFSGDPFCPICRLPLTTATAAAPANPFNFRRFMPRPVEPVEPVHFSDDDPLLAAASGAVPPDDGRSLAVTGVAERPAVAASESVADFTVLVGVKAAAFSGGRAPIDLVTVLDVSGSMSGSKLALVKRAVGFVIDRLGPSDRLSVVSFSSRATRMLRLRRMSESGREEAKRAVNSLIADGGTNIVDGLKKGVQVLEERREMNPVSSIIFLSDGNDTCNHGGIFFPTTSGNRNLPEYLHLLPASIRPRNNNAFAYNAESIQTIPVHTFGFGSDHDPIAMHAISDASGGTFSFIESYEVVQDAFAGCLGGLLSVVAREVRLDIRSASHGVEIKSIPSGRYPSEIVNDGSQGVIRVGDMYADEHKEFLINVSVPSIEENENDTIVKTSLLDVSCYSKDVVSNEMTRVEGDLIEIRRPATVSLTDMMVNLSIDRQRNRVLATEAISEAQRMAETGDFDGARTLLADKRSVVFGSAAAQAGDGLSMWLEADMKETESRMLNRYVYQQTGRAYALSGISSHGSQRATIRGGAATAAATESVCFGAAAPAGAGFNGYATPQMASMVLQSQRLRKIEEENGISKK